MSVAALARRPWLTGPAADLLLGCGLGYLLLVGALALVRPDMITLRPFLPLLILLTGVPHYGATLVRAYGSGEARRRYRAVSVHASAVVWATFAVAAFQPWLGCLLITLYLSWSPWHYAGQNYGLALMFLGRAGLRLPPLARRMLRASFALSVALTLLNLHRVLGVGSGDPLFDATGAYHFLRLGVPEGAVRWLFPPLALGYLTCLAVVGWHLRAARGQALLPAAALVLTQAIWFALPAALAHLARPGLLDAIGAPVAFVWIAIAHSVQYLWVSHHFARSAGPGASGGGAPWGGRVLLAGAAIWVLPALLFAPGALGRVPFEAGLGLLVAAAVNLHHFVLDGAVWKLRDPPVGRVLVAGERPAPTPERERRVPVFATSALVTAGLFSIVCWLGVAWEKEVGQRRAVAAGDLTRARQAAERLRFFGRDGPHLRNALGRLEERRGAQEAALREYRRSLELQPTPAAWTGVGRIADQRGDRNTARQAYAAALALDPARDSVRRRLDQILSDGVTANAAAPASTPSDAYAP
jgi:hypothetical protein